MEARQIDSFFDLIDERYRLSKLIFSTASLFYSLTQPPSPGLLSMMSAMFTFKDVKVDDAFSTQSTLDCMRDCVFSSNAGLMDDLFISDVYNPVMCRLHKWSIGRYHVSGHPVAESLALFAYRAKLDPSLVTILDFKLAAMAEFGLRKYLVQETTRGQLDEIADEGESINYFDCLPKEDNEGPLFHKFPFEIRQLKWISLFGMKIMVVAILYAILEAIYYHIISKYRIATIEPEVAAQVE
ncbi:hypothetical protein HDE_13255 [Halotydeus destructor]|nr:hypothetical protein HDE_13255 [Halotydeus destructor]